MKESKGLNGDLKPENKKTTHKATMSQTTLTLTDRQRPSETDWVSLRTEVKHRGHPSKCDKLPFTYLWIYDY